MRNLDRPVNITNGAKGISGVDSLNLFGLKFSGVYHWFGFKVPALWLWYYLLMLVIVAIILSACGYGTRALAAHGMPSARMKTSPARWASTCVTTSCWPSLSALPSAAWRGAVRRVPWFCLPESFTLQESIAVLAMVVLGGMGHIPGVILGAVLLTALPECCAAVRRRYSRRCLARC